jgi:hypothetical protein
MGLRQKVPPDVTGMSSSYRSINAPADSFDDICH